VEEDPRPGTTTLKWDLRFLELAALVASWSKDPSTRVGVVITRPNNTVASLGFNGFPRGIADDHRLNDRDKKYPLIVHGEANAIVSAREPLHGYTLYVWPFFTCSSCALLVVQAGIKRVVAPVLPPYLVDRWGESVRAAEDLYREAGVAFDHVS
jgi:dCMP deaminase